MAVFGAGGLFGGRGGGGIQQQSGGGQQDGGDGGGGNQGDDELIIPNGEHGDESGNEPDAAKLLAGFFGDDSGDDENGGDGNGDGEEAPRGQGQNRNQNQNGDGNGGGGGDDPEQQLANQVAVEVNNMLKNISAPEDMIPENFDPNDPAQFRGVLTKAMQHSAMNAMQITFKPMQVAMKQLATDIKNQIQTELKGYGTQQSAQQILKRIVPEADTEEYGGLANGLFNQAMKKKGATAEGAAKMVRTALDNFGIAKKGSGGNGGGNNDPFVGGFKTGDAALDTFAPMPKPRSNQNQNRR